MTEKMRDKIKTIIENYEKKECVRIPNRVQFLYNSDEIIYNPPARLQKGVKKDGKLRE